MSSEYLSIVTDIIENKEFKKLENEKHHHCTNRYVHSCNVALSTYKICKRLKLDYVSATRAALVHDFFYNDEFDNKKKRMMYHYKKSIENASKITFLTSKQKDMIASHMFPVGGKFPRSKEAIVLDVCDDIVSIKEKFNSNKQKLKFACIFLYIFFFSFFINKMSLK